MVIGVLIGWGWRISYNREQRVAQQRCGSPRCPSRPEARFPLWAGSPAWSIADGPTRTEAIRRDDVPLGRRYALAAGFLEITYDTGARVILQGPVTYEVESASSGFLSLRQADGAGGKQGVRGRTQGSGWEGERTVNPMLSNRQPQVGRETQPTASLALRPLFGKSESRKPKAESSNPQSLIPNPLFAVRTPTAVVTDLGTEFGVEVAPSGATRSHVFRGKVELRPAGRRQQGVRGPVGTE